MATSLQRYMAQRQAQRARPTPLPPARKATAQPIVPTVRQPARNTMAPPVRQPAVNTMAPPVPRPIAQPVTAPPTGMAQQPPVAAPGQMAPPMAQGQQAPVPPPSLFKEPLAPEFAPTPTPNPLLGGMTPGDALGGGLTMQQPDGTRKGQTQQMPQPNLDIYGGMTPGDALGGGLTMKQPQQQPQMSQLLSVMPADFAAQITPEQLAALTPDQMTQMIAKFSQPAAPQYVGHGDELINPRTPVITDYMGKGQVYGLGRSNPLSM